LTCAFQGEALTSVKPPGNKAAFLSSPLRSLRNSP